MKDPLPVSISSMRFSFAATWSIITWPTPRAEIFAADWVAFTTRSRATRRRSVSPIKRPSAASSPDGWRSSDLLHLDDAGGGGLLITADIQFHQVLPGRHHRQVEKN